MAHAAERAPPNRLLPTSVLVVLTGSAVFFAGTAAAPALTEAWGLTEGEAAALTLAVQAGFIVGTLASALLNLPDRVAPGRLLGMLLVGAGAVNGAFALLDADLPLALGLRFLAGALAGPVYPVGMKLLATWWPRLGWQLGVMLGAYTLGLGVAFVLRAAALPWQPSVLGASALAGLGAMLAVRLRAGPLLATRSPLDLGAARQAFRLPAFRRVAFAYFGHMWELFAFWALLPFWLAAAGWDAASAAALVGAGFAAGAAGCVAAGAWSRRVGEARAARLALAVSGAFCLLSPVLFTLPRTVQALAVLVWAAAVIADSPMFSALSARAAPPRYVGTALTVQNSLGFALTLVPLTLLPVWAAWPGIGGWQWAFLLLAPGPLLGLWFLQRLARPHSVTSTP